MPFKRVKVVMLATKEKAIENQICINSVQMFMWTKQHDLVAHALVEYRNTDPQHLYFLSDEEFGEGDWILHLHMSRIIKNINLEKRDGDLYKIIASTDPSLGLPQPSLGFIRKFIEKWEDDEKIEEVEVEYTDWCDYDDDNTWGGCDQPDLRVKISSKDNTITIISVKNSWDKKELTTVIKAFANDFVANTETAYKQAEIETWLMKNL